MKPEDYTKLYKAVPVFKSLTREELDEILAISRLFKAPKDYVVLEEGKPGHGMYIIVSGMATCRLRLFQGDDTHLANLHKGAVFGEMSLIDDGPVSATVTMMQDSVLYHIDKAKFAELRTGLRPAAFKILRELGPVICERLRAINSRIGEVFSEPQKHMTLMEQRYQSLARHARPLDAPERGRSN